MEGPSWPDTGVLPRGNVFHWLLPKELCIAWSKSLSLSFHRSCSIVIPGFVSGLKVFRIPRDP